MVSGIVSHIQKYCLQDGPGIRTSVFLKGCPLDCAWCHNPENIAPKPQVVQFEGRCIHCGECRKVCPQEAVHSSVSELPASAAALKTVQCRACGACVEACPAGARVMVGRRLTAAELLKEILTDRVFYDESQGGVTFSGGEPLSQPAFLRVALAGCRELGLHTAVDTCGFAPRKELLDVAPLVDLFLYDLKLMDDVRHREFCGASNQVILENLKALGRVHSNIWVRVPVIPGINDYPADLEAVAQFILRLQGVRRVHLLPYHRIGIGKFDRLGRAYRLNKTLPPSVEQLERALIPFASAGLPTTVGG
jgi:pyruvate formate lyase activating enzyme